MIVNMPNCFIAGGTFGETRGGSSPRLACALSPAVALPVTAYIWGLTVGDQDHAEREARRGWSRCAWDFVEFRRSTGDTCALNLLDGKALAAGTGRGWAYVVYPVGFSENRRELRNALLPFDLPRPIGISGV